jgi:membrane associated rhomboid family serine protease
MVLIPLSDDAPLQRHEPPFVTYAIIALSILVFAWRVSTSNGEDIVFERHWGVVPQSVFDGGDALHRFGPLVTYMFLHGGFMHIAGNMLFLWIFGDDIEDAFGHARFALFYLACGIVGALVYCFFTDMREAPLVGASGAIAGVMGAYLMIRPCAHVHVLVFIRVVAIRAMWVILFWSGLQVWHIAAADGGNTAWWAHIGGLVTGVVLTALVRRPHVGLFECVDQKTFVSPWQDTTVNRTRR